MPNWSEEGFQRILEAGYRGGLTVKEKFKKIKEEYYTNPKLCLICSNPIPYEKRRINTFCSRTCYNIGARSHGNSPSISSKEKDDKSYCLSCNKELSRKAAKYCSIKCQKTYHFNKKLVDWISGNTKVKSRNFFRRYLTETYGYECSCCSISEWNGKPIVLEIDHIDGNPENNRPENIRFICPNCHSQTDTYKAKNTGNGRHYRRTRYLEGKSY